MKGETEVQLCVRIRAWGESLGFDVYPEVDGWDLVMVSDQERRLGLHSFAVIEPGKQVGIHAKLRASFEVLSQACWECGSHPAYAFVAVPVAGHAFRAIARKLGIGVIEASVQGQWNGGERIRVRELRDPLPVGTHPQLHLPPVASRCIEAGAPSPRVLSHWRVKALRFLEHVRSKGVVTASDLVRFGLAKSWADRWLVAEDWTTESNKRGKVVRVRTYRLRTDDKTALPDHGYEDVAAELLAAAPASSDTEKQEQLSIEGTP